MIIAVIILCILVVLGNEGWNLYKKITSPPPPVPKSDPPATPAEPTVRGYRYKFKPHYGSEIFKYKVQVWTPQGHTLFSYDGELTKNKDAGMRKINKAIKLHQEGTEEGTL